ncbi:MAG: PEP/pyruvate-binding domain-containing protein [Chloroflexota bacterium]
MKALIKSSTCKSIPSRALIGGKGQQLAQLTRHGLPVPAWICLSTAAFNHVTVPLLEKKVDSEADASALRQEIVDALLPADLQSELERAITELLQDSASGAISIRSSATLEDDQSATYAGQFDTFLGVTDVATALDKTKACWASLWSAHAQHYHAQKDDPNQAAMAVILQTFIPADMAGVLFTANPVTQQTDECVIEASWGLGEPLVSGEIVPDHYVLQLDPETGAVIEVITTQIGSKAEGLFWQADTKRLERKPNLRYFQQRPALQQEQLFQLAYLGRNVQNCFGTPQDIEWAIYQGELYLLQARPITTVVTR